MDIIQTFYDNLALHYDKLFLDWDKTIKEQAVILDKIFKESGFSYGAKILDCACGIGTQAIGLALLEYNVTASDISEGELKEAEKRALKEGVHIIFKNADFRKLSKTFTEKFDVVICMDNALPHMLTKNDLETAIVSIAERITSGGMFVLSIRDYDELLKDKPPYSPPYIHKSGKGQRVSFQTWEWDDDCYKLIQYIIDDEKKLEVNKFECSYRAVKRDELTDMLFAAGFKSVEWKFPKETSFYQPICIARK